MTETWVCRACGAPVPVARRGCPYCGAVVERAAPGDPDGALRGVPAMTSPLRTFCPDCGSLYPSAAPTCPRCPPLPSDALARRAGAARCPGCGQGMRTAAIGAVTVDRCDACGGTWFDRGEVGRVLDLRTRGGRDRGTADRLEAHFAPGMPPRDARRGRACVVCRGRMTRRLVASKGPVYVDVCSSHGLWFDAGEWEAFSAFVAEGGLEVERDRADHGVRARRARHDLSEGRDADRLARGLWGFFDTSR